MSDANDDFERPSGKTLDGATESQPRGHHRVSIDAIDDTGPDDEPAGLYGSDRTAAEQRTRLLGGEVPVAVYGLGKMGLPLAGVLASVTGNVLGADIDQSVVQTVADGECHVVDEPGLADLVRNRVAEGALRATPEPALAARIAAIHVIVVPTLTTENDRPDLSALESVLADVGGGLAAGDLVCVESTVPPRTCADVVVPTLAERSGLEPDEFGVAFCPERTASGRALEDITTAYPKVVGGVDPESTRVARLLYEHVTENDVIAVANATTAEAMKVFSGVYRDVNIALANEFARYATAIGVDVHEVIEAANTQPHANLLSPGPGVGGHCIPVYPYFLLNGHDVDSPLIRVARLVNDEMPRFTVELVRDALNRSGVDLSAATVAILGITYRPGVAERRNSPAIPIADGLAKRGARVCWVDPLVDSPDAVPGTSCSLSEVIDRSPDAFVVVTPHESFMTLDWAGLESTIVVDCHAALDLDDSDHDVYAIGRPFEADDPVRGDAPPGGGTDLPPPMTGGRGRAQSDDG